MMSATSGDIRFDRIAPSSTTMVASPSSGSMSLSPMLFFTAIQRKFEAAINQLK
ncbi:hypothetical protein SAMN05446635_8161 [Burkholderia sp. OK233]|nr:hypothetical protein SAMN05446635_8161 [Burkholderia sp. OK233]